MTSSYECSLCYLIYNDRDRHPVLIVVCGHTFCKRCLSDSGIDKCPVCRMEFDADTQLVRNFTVAEIVRQYKNQRMLERKSQGRTPRLSIFEQRRKSAVVETMNMLEPLVIPDSSRRVLNNQVAHNSLNNSDLLPHMPAQPSPAGREIRPPLTQRRPSNPFLQILICGCARSSRKKHNTNNEGSLSMPYSSFRDTSAAKSSARINERAQLPNIPS